MLYGYCGDVGFLNNSFRICIFPLILNFLPLKLNGHHFLLKLYEYLTSGVVIVDNLIMAQEWNIKSRSQNCSSCEKEFNDQDDCYSALTFTDEGYVRGDYCSDCWNQHDLEETAFSTWHGLFIVPPPPEEEPLKKETAESLLRKMLEDDEPNIGVIYILAVMLERKRILVERDVKITEDNTIRIYEHKKNGETFLITEPHLQLDKLEEVQRQVVDLLGGGARNDEGGTMNDEEKREQSTMNVEQPTSAVDDQSDQSDPSNDLVQDTK